jgi:hypothetical protein
MRQNRKRSSERFFFVRVARMQANFRGGDEHFQFIDARQKRLTQGFATSLILAADFSAFAMPY